MWASSIGRAPQIPLSYVFVPPLRDIAEAARTLATANDGVIEEKRLCNIFQVAIRINTVVRDKQTGVYHSLEVPLICPLQAGDSTSSEVVQCVIEKVSGVPFWRNRQQFPHNFELPCCDGAEPND